VAANRRDPCTRQQQLPPLQVPLYVPLQVQPLLLPLLRCILNCLLPTSFSRSRQQPSEIYCTVAVNHRTLCCLNSSAAAFLILTCLLSTSFSLSSTLKLLRRRMQPGFTSGCGST
jgi:hypothetical protein